MTELIAGCLLFIIPFLTMWVYMIRTKRIVDLSRLIAAQEELIDVMKTEIRLLNRHKRQNCRIITHHERMRAQQDEVLDSLSATVLDLREKLTHPEFSPN